MNHRGVGHGYEAAFNCNRHQHLHRFWVGLVGPKTFAAAPASATKIDFDQVVNRAGKSDRLPSIKAVLPESVLLPNCEPVASPFADPILGRIVGRCDA
jgi:hypothetical protein